MKDQRDVIREASTQCAQPYPLKGGEMMINITPKSTKPEIIQASMEYIDLTDRQIKRQKEINLFLFWCLGVVSVYALIF